MTICDDIRTAIKILAVAGATASISEGQKGAFSVMPSQINTPTDIYASYPNFVPTVWDEKTQTWIKDENAAGGDIPAILGGKGNIIPVEYTRNKNNALTQKINMFTSNFYSKHERPDYNADTFTCVNFAKMMVEEANKEGLPAYVATAVSKNGPGHAFVAFDTSGRMEILGNKKIADTVAANKAGIFAPQQLILFDPQKITGQQSINYPLVEDYKSITIYKNPTFKPTTSNGAIDVDWTKTNKNEMVTFNNIGDITQGEERKIVTNETWITTTTPAYNSGVV